MTHHHLWEDQLAADAKRCVDVDEAVCLRPFIRDGERAGFLFAHDQPDQPHRCEGALSTNPGDSSPTWDASGSLDDGTLTLSPSVLCTIDGFHGWVRDGKWVPA